MRRHVKSTILATGLVLILGSLIIQSCCKKPLPPPPPPVEEEDPTLEVSFPKEEIPYGEKDIVLSWITTNTKSLYINGIKRSGESHTILDRLFQDTIFVFRAVNVKKEVEKEVILKVGDWKTSIFGKVSRYPWRYKEMGFSDMNGKVLVRWIPTEEERSWIVYYHRNGVITFSNYPGHTELWYLKNDSTIVRNGFDFKLQVSEDEMTLSYQQEGFTWNGQSVWINLIYEHASDTPTDP